jgi:uncharacterized membrane protein
VTTTQIQSIIDALKTAGGAGWQALVSQQVSSGWVAMGACAFFLLVGIVAAIVARVVASKTNWESNDEGFGADVVFIIAVVVSMTLIILSVSMFLLSVNQVINPNGAAITQLLNGL